MKKAIFVSILVISTYAKAFSQKHLDKLNSKTGITYQDLIHENLGCPENSLCSEASGKRIQLWEKSIKKWKSMISPSKSIESFRKKYGIPVEFLTKKSEIADIDPVLWNSRCPQHNPKDKEQKIFKGMSFLQKDPQLSTAIFDTVTLYQGKISSQFNIPYMDQPLLVKNKKLVIVKEYDGFYYNLAISKSGSWNIINLTAEEIKQANEVRIDTKCPVKSNTNPLYMSSFCKKIWNADNKKENTIQLFWSCP